jgi:hypothetical protein
LFIASREFPCRYRQPSSRCKHPKGIIHENPSILIHMKHNSIIPPMLAATRGIRMNSRCLVTGSSRLSNDTLQLIDLRLGTTESTELLQFHGQHISRALMSHVLRWNTYPLLGQLTRTLVLAIAEEFDNTTLVRGKTVQWQVSRGPSSRSFTIIPVRSNDATYPETSLTISLTNAVRLLKWPLVLLTLGLTTRASVFCTDEKIALAR